MGQKIHPVGARLGIVRNWSSRWYASTKKYAKFVAEDFEIRKYILTKFKGMSVGEVIIERLVGGVRVIITTSRPGVIIGKKGEDIDLVKRHLSAKLGVNIEIAIEEIKKPELNARLVAESMCLQLEKRIQFRRVMKRAVANAMRSNCLGIKVSVAGRLNGADIARTEWYREGRVPLHTFRADIDYATYEANTTYGIIGVKVWIFKGEILDKNYYYQRQVNN